MAVPPKSLHAEHIRVGAGAGQRQDEDIVFDFIDKQSIWRDAALPVALKIPREGVVMALHR